jgi:hypothetical protein
MNWVLVIFAAVTLAAGAGLLWWRKRVGQEIGLMAATPTSKAAEVARLAPGTVAEVKGTLRCATPLIAEFSKQACAYFKSDVRREVVYYETDSQGKRERKTRTENLQSSTRFAPCVVEDDSGQVAIHLDAADIEGQQEVVNRREPEPQSLAAAVVGIAIGGTSDSATRIYTETILATNIPIYVLGEVAADRGIGKPAANSKNRVFVVSTKSEEERSKSLGSSMTWLLVFAVLFFAAAAVLAFFAIQSSIPPS